jgi:gas vesicle protein
MFGVGVGAAAGAMLAPKSGSDIRRELFGRQNDVFEEPGTSFPSVEEPEAIEDLKDRIEETRARLKAEIEAQQES